MSSTNGFSASLMQFIPELSHSLFSSVFLTAFCQLNCCSALYGRLDKLGSSIRKCSHVIVPGRGMPWLSEISSSSIRSSEIRSFMLFSNDFSLRSLHGITCAVFSLCFFGSSCESEDPSILFMGDFGGMISVNWLLRRF